VCRVKQNRYHVREREEISRMCQHVLFSLKRKFFLREKGQMRNHEEEG